MSPALTEPITLAGRTAPSRVIFGPHVTDLGDGRAFSDRHVAYYARRARGGCGIVVTETASVHPSDHPYERAPLAEHCGDGYRRIVEACRPHGTLVLAGLGHRGLQGSSAWTRAPLWAPSRVPDPVTRELPAEATEREIAELVESFARAAVVAAEAGLDGVELDAGPTSLLRQFLSGLTNRRDDAYGTERLRLLREAIAAVRVRIGSDRILALRLSCDENAPWAGITPDIAAGYVRAIASSVDLLTVVRGGLFSPESYRPDAHVPAGFNDDLCRRIRDEVSGSVPIALQGSIVDAGHAQRVLSDSACDLVEMTRAQIADPDLVLAARRGRRPRPCVRCNQACLVDDFHNPVVGCIANPEAGDETRDPPEPVTSARDVLVVGAGPAGLEAARVAAMRGHRVVLVEADERVGGTIAAVSCGGRPDFAALVDWLEQQCRESGVGIRSGTEASAADIADALAAGTAVVQATGGLARPPSFPVTAPERYATAAEVLSGTRQPTSPTVVWDPTGGPVAGAVVDRLVELGGEVHYATGDPVAGSRLAPTGDLVASDVRMQRAGVVRHLGCRVASVDDDGVVLVDRVSGESTRVADAVLVDCAPLLPAEVSEWPGSWSIGDRVAPRTVREAVREGYRVATAL
ncbi:mycofactocin system FadH/OYE family oxidoreductase 1 [Rhodococcus rhodochrous]|uniref:mycofactocin system FadH/OYE family oxidoreductase 1 n=1 Tax=Rhodococcus rhodochrous TaxID=1829 RepID=UPI001E3573AC|nr:mycofactocin system FadH/OYE family oxidoreductase 1 [Rhodococcus rhodochrous]MCD2097320.1 mycofactocin system FadH/OYE family oxidoreductase 1 [Rhodococcus rhodochrous]MCD2120248.1 mycofactocin system FadH/OYE family oxidoreductase 1 [Rhodococcus rhodochrous]MCQ4133280.1 mycofactocin system FadH/OYE family oxidoreductase 1 [Rhodococcus rhodochrous]MDJ0017113.1 mycofactocin system FadH/OYE family oxidoreductase 1 [Rhodococcus rhodochrous]